MRTLAGLDGCHGGWVVASAAANLAVLAFHIVPNIKAAFELIGPSTLGAIDIPIGLPDSGSRACESAARAVLAKRHASVFTPPCRSALKGSSYAECCELNFRACGKKLTLQAHGILKKIREVDRAMVPELQKVVREAHPEVAFRILGGRPLQDVKKRVAGREERLAILRAEGVEFDPEVERLRLGRSHVEIDDLLDAAVCLLTARRIAEGRAQVLGDGALDSRGLRMEIVA